MPDAAKHPLPDSAEALAAPATRQPRVLANKTYFVLIDEDGGGASRIGEIEIASGFFTFVRDLETRRAWNAAEDAGGDIETRLEITLCAGDDAELRRVTVTNRSTHRRTCTVTGHAEPRLAEPASFASHPAFSKLFLQTEIVEGGRALLARRRPRARGETSPWVAFAIVGGGSIEAETDRARYFERGQTERTPRAVLDGRPLSGTVGSVLDPVLALRATIDLAPGSSVSVTFLLGTAPDRDGAIALAKRHGSETAVERAFAQGAQRVSAHEVARDASGPFTGEHAASDHDPSLGREENLRYFNGIGGFSERGDEYVIRLRRTSTGLALPPRPWINVVANERFGFLVSETGAGTTWSENSREHRLTPWSNDPLLDPHGEALYIRDEDSGAFWSPLPGPCPGLGDYEARHGFGTSLFHHVSFGIETRTELFVPTDEPAKITSVTIRNRTARARTLSIVAVSPLVLGTTRAEATPFVMTEPGPSPGTLLARSRRGGDFAGRVACAGFATNARVRHASVSGDLARVLGPGGTMARPRALVHGGALDGRTGPDMDPCFAQRILLELPPREEIEVSFLLGDAPSGGEAMELLDRWGRPDAVERARENVHAFWSRQLSALRIETPSPALDLLVNGWLPYQALACRLWARSALYQSGGAFGFRDQLQDASSFAATWPSIPRAQLLLHAAHQFVEGDVLHWWHPPASRGIRTRFSDDLLWLPYLTMDYVSTTGDHDVLAERVRFLTARPLAAGEDEAYLLPEDSGTSADLYTHCCRAIDRSSGVGAHGLPLFGSGDWNDGMNRVGIEGRGESVWLGFFLVAILEGFAPICARRGDAARERDYRERAASLRAALNDAGWDGDWYRRGYFDDGTPLGSAASDECRIDALAQAWSVISGVAPPDRAALAMESVERHLVSEQDGLIRLLTPPFENTPHDPGYIKGYVAGVRENGGQYTHAALWAVAAMARLGRNDRVARWLDLLNPILHTHDAHGVARYQVEPYVIAADVYGAPPHVGRGGWTWYTGSAGWMSRVALEELLGIRLEDGTTIRVKPCIPDDWPEFTVRLRLPGDETRVTIRASNPAGVARAVVSATLDGQAVDVRDGEARAPIPRDGGEHELQIVLGRRIGVPT